MIRRLIILLLIVGCGETVAPDTTAPTVVITYPANSSTLTETATVTVDVADDGDIGFVKLLVDGVETYADTTAPYQFVWDVCVQATGTHTLLAKTEDGAGNQGQSDLLTFTINASYDCADVCGGDKLLDNCDVCDIYTTNDCTKDECGVWGGDNTTCPIDCNGRPNGSAFIDNCGLCVGGDTNELPCYELIFSDDFNIANQVLPNTNSSNWGYVASQFSTISIDDNKLVFKGSNDGYMHHIYGGDLYIFPQTELIINFEFSAEIGHIESATEDNSMYGLFLTNSNSNRTYYFIIQVKPNGSYECWDLLYYSYETNSWTSIYSWVECESFIPSDYDISDINFKLTYSAGYLYGYLNEDLVFDKSISNFQCSHFGIYQQKDAKYWVDNVSMYGREVESGYELGRYSINDLPKISPILPYNP